MPEIEREAARLLILAPTDRVLLLRLEPSFRAPFWVTPGGGIDGAETIEQAAYRELREEVGRDDLRLGPLLWSRHVEFEWEERQVRQDERTFLVPVDREFEAVVRHPDQEPITASRWFGTSELDSLEETVYPEDLAARLRLVLQERSSRG